jgi:HlyD family secretion protein
LLHQTMIRDTAGQDRLLATPARQRVRRWLLAAFSALALLALSAYATRGWLSGERSVDSARIRIATVERGTLVRDIAVDGRVTAANSPTLYAIVAGIVDLKVGAGDKVGKGQALAEIESPDLKSRLTQEQATLVSLEAEVGRAQLDVQQVRAATQMSSDQAEVDRQTAARELDRLQRAYDLGAVAQIDVLRAQDNLKKADIALSHARAAGRLRDGSLGFDLRTRRQALDRQRAVVGELQRQVGALVIRSPVEGQVGQVLVAQRANVAANAPVLTVVDLTAFEVEFEVPESFARDLEVGMSAEVRAANRQYAGKVRSISPEVVSGEVVGRLQLVGDNPAGLRQNQRVSVRILLDEKANTLMVERGTFLESGGGRHAWFVRDGVAERRLLEIGATSLNAVEILAGAKVGDRIVVSGAESFGNAERVRISGH